jgi:hypothetical protein
LRTTRQKTDLDPTQSLFSDRLLTILNQPFFQCGSYIFMDADYGRNRDRDGEPTKTFEPSLFVWRR